MTTASGKYSGEQITIVFEADYFDGGELESITVRSMTILDVSVDMHELPLALRKAIWELADEVEFERDEYTPEDTQDYF